MNKYPKHVLVIELSEKENLDAIKEAEERQNIAISIGIDRKPYIKNMNGRLVNILGRKGEIAILKAFPELNQTTASVESNIKKISNSSDGDYMNQTFEFKTRHFDHYNIKYLFERIGDYNKKTKYKDWIIFATVVGNIENERNIGIWGMIDSSKISELPIRKKYNAYAVSIDELIKPLDMKIFFKRGGNDK